MQTVHGADPRSICGIRVSTGPSQDCAPHWKRRPRAAARADAVAGCVPKKRWVSDDHRCARGAYGGGSLWNLYPRSPTPLR